MSWEGILLGKRHKISLP